MCCLVERLSIPPASPLYTPSPLNTTSSARPGPRLTETLPNVLCLSQPHPSFGAPFKIPSPLFSWTPQVALTRSDHPSTEQCTCHHTLSLTPLWPVWPTISAGVCLSRVFVSLLCFYAPFTALHSICTVAAAVIPLRHFPARQPRLPGGSLAWPMARILGCPSSSGSV